MRLLSPDMRVAAGMDMAPDMATVPDMMSEAIAFSKPPFVQLTGDGRARLRFETRSEQALEVSLKKRGGASTEFLATTQLDELDFEWPPGALAKSADIPDVSGLHNLQEVAFADLEAGATYEWIVHRGQGVEATGSFKAGQDPSAALSLGWISDTMFPRATDSALALAGAAPDVILHGGELQYMTNQLDTWNGIFHALSPLTSIAPFHSCIGNHEYEGLDEFEAQYKRLFGGHGYDASTVDYTYIDVAGVRMLLLNSEIELAAPDSPQHRWMRARLAEVQDDPALRFAVVAFHRPFFTFSKSRPNFGARDRLHPVFQQYGVPLVFTGHNHCYERFEVDGITYVMDGGGGASSYDPNAHLDDVIAERPSDRDLRLIAERSYGVTLARIEPDSTIQVTRYKADGGVTETYSIG